MLWESPKVNLKGEVPEVRNVDGRLHIAQKERRSDEWDPPYCVRPRRHSADHSQSAAAQHLSYGHRRKAGCGAAA